MLTIDTMNDSLIERKQKENKNLKKQIATLQSNNEDLENNVKKIAIENKDLKEQIKILTKKIARYEHDPVKYKKTSDGHFDVLYWDYEKEDYSIFATFYPNNLEKDLDDFCNDFILMIMDTYCMEE